jgi:beta-lactamase superfamily II metal-dependent hydrolase
MSHSESSGPFIWASLTKNKEFELMCPTNRIGTVDVLLGLHHGVDTSNSEVLVHALRPRWRS